MNQPNDKSTTCLFKLDKQVVGHKRINLTLFHSIQAFHHNKFHFAHLNDA